MSQNIGKISQVIGAVIDVEFEPGKLPEIYHGPEGDQSGHRCP